VAPRSQRRHQVNYLLRTAVKMAPGFDMKYFHFREEE
jgi:hypothetical protein